MSVLRDDVSEPSPLSIAEREMRAGERLIWADRPVAPARQMLAMLPVSLFGMVFAGFAAFWIIGAASVTPDNGVFSFFPLFGIPFLLVGLGIMLLPVWAWMGAKKTVYAISSDRLVIIARGSVRSFEPQEIENLERRERPDGTGDIIFSRDDVRTHSSRGSRTRVRREGFFGIPEVRRVEDEIRRLKQRGRD